MDCPFKYYLKYIGNINGEKDFSAFTQGLVKHKTMEQFARDFPDQHELENLEDKEIEKILDEIISDKWEEFVHEELSSHLLIKQIEIANIKKDLLETINYIKNGYYEFKSGKNPVRLMYSNTLSTELEVRGKLNVKDFKNIEIDTRIDRMDLLKNNYQLNKKGKFLNEKDEKAYSLIDYKNKSSRQSEQLLLYYLGIIRSKKLGEISDKDFYLLFLPMSLKGKEQKYITPKFLMKIENNHIIINKNTKTFIKIPFNQFNEWLYNVLQNIHGGNFYPWSIYKEKVPKRFVFYLSNETEFNEVKATKSDEKYYCCKINNKKACEYYKLCSALGFLKDFHLEERKGQK